MQNRLFMSALAAAALALALGCGGNDADEASAGGASDGGSSGTATAAGGAGGGGAGAGGSIAVSVTVTPERATVAPGQSRQFAAVVSGAADGSVVWSVKEGASGGAITDAGFYTAPSGIGTYHAVATSVADPTKSGEAVIQVPPKAPGVPGVWQNVTPDGMSIDPDFVPIDNFGANGLLVDPARPSDVYALVCNQGVWKSTDYGATWAKISTGEGGDMIDAGRPWGSAIDPDPARDPSTPPTMYTMSGYGAGGLWKSLDGGVSWASVWNVVLASDESTDIKSQVGNDLSGLVIDPLDKQHLLVGIHGNAPDASYNTHVFETKDGGATWKDAGSPGGANQLFFVTSTTWISQGDFFAGEGTRRTTNSGATWTNVSEAGHPHGGSAMHDAGNGELYLTAMNALYKSTDSGATWNPVAGTSHTSTVVATATKLYSSYGWANLGGQDPDLRHAELSTGIWTENPTPDGMSNGGNRWGVTSDGEHYIIVGANWLAGIWRYIEP